MKLDKGNWFDCWSATLTYICSPSTVGFNIWRWSYIAVGYKHSILNAIKCVKIGNIIPRIKTYIMWSIYTGNNSFFFLKIILEYHWIQLPGVSGQKFWRCFTCVITIIILHTSNEGIVPSKIIHQAGREKFCYKTSFCYFEQNQWDDRPSPNI